MRQSKEIADIIKYFLKTNNIRYISVEDMYNIANMKYSEKIKIPNIIDILKFEKVILFDADFLLYKNNYYEEAK